MRSSKSRSRHAVDIQERGAREVVNLPLVLGAEKAFYGTFPLRNPGGGEPDPRCPRVRRTQDSSPSRHNASLS